MSFYELLQEGEYTGLNIVYPDFDTVVDNYFGAPAALASAGSSLYFGVGASWDAYWQPASPTAFDVHITVVYYDNGGTLTLGYSSDAVTETTNSSWDDGNPSNNSDIIPRGLGQGDTATWVTASLSVSSFYLNHLVYGDTYNDPDFRLYMADGSDLYVQAISVQDSTKGALVRWPARTAITPYPTPGVGMMPGHAMKFDNIPLINGIKFTNNSPTAGKVAWAVCYVTYKGKKYRIAAGNTSAKYIWWQIGSPNVFQSGASLPALAADQFLVALNQSGTAYPSIFATAIYADYISVANLAAISANMGALTVDDVLTIGASGGLYQGTGSFAAPTTGMKIAQSGNLGYLEGWQNGSLQMRLDSSGKLQACYINGVPQVTLDQNGLAVVGSFSGTTNFTWGPRTPGTLANDATVGTVNWTNVSGANVPDGGVAYAPSPTTGSAITTHYIKATGFGFNVPSDATIAGLLVEILRGGSTVTDNSIKIIKGGVIGGTEKSTGATWQSGTFRWDSFGGSSDLFGQTWTPTDINASGFGVALSASVPANQQAQVDAIRITVYYTRTATVSPVQMNGQTIQGLGNAVNQNDAMAFGQYVAPKIVTGGNLNGTVGASSTIYLSPYGQTNSNAAEGAARMYVPAATWRTIKFRLSGTQPASGSLVWELYINGVATLPTITISAGQTSTTVTTDISSNNITTAEGDTMSIQVVNNATAASIGIREYAVIGTLT